MRVVFLMRNPGAHTEIGTLDLDSVPREGEMVALTADSEVHEVHNVTWILYPPSVQILLK